MKRIVPLLEFIPRISPRYTAPEHLASLVQVFERVAVGETVEAVVSAPPRCEKTETIAHGIAWLLRQRPSMRVCYASYGQRLSNKKSRRIRMLCDRARVPLDPDAASKSDWRTGVEEGGLWATSRDGAAVGEGFDLIVVDDIVKDRVEAESALARERSFEWMTDTMYPRLEPSGSVIVCMHRWHPDDLAGHLVAEGWEEHNFPALNERGEALLPSRYSVERLAKIRERIGEYAWESLYMGRPRGRGGAVFRDVNTFAALPPESIVAKAIGVDFAYSRKTHADYSCAVVLASDGERWFVLDVVRLQVTAPEFMAQLERLRLAHPGAPLVAYVSGTERGTVDMMIAQGVPIDATPAVADKFTRAQPAAAAWNAGKILVPENEKLAWRSSFVTELNGFTGINDRNDDQVDALTAAFDAISTRVGQSFDLEAILNDPYWSAMPRMRV